MLTQWEMELNMLEDWLDSQEPEGGSQELAKPEERASMRSNWRKLYGTNQQGEAGRS
jgi:hypothetical protein